MRDSTVSMNQDEIATDVAADDAPVVTTRTELREAAVAKWREDMNASVTSPVMWSSLALVYVLGMALSALYLGSEPIVIALVVVALTAACWTMLVRMRRRDRAFRSLATLTPLLDVSVARGEGAVLRAQFGALLATMANPKAARADHVQALDRLDAAALPLMRRGGVTPETAAVAGYPAWPEIDRTVMPGQENDRLSVHLHRIEASILRLCRTLDGEEVLLEETIARMAGEIVPPSRSVREVMEGR